MPPHNHDDTEKIAKTLQRVKRNIGCSFVAAGMSLFGVVGFFVGATLGAGTDAVGKGGTGAFVGVMVGIFIGGLLAGAVEAILDWMCQVLISQADILEQLKKKSDH